MLEDTRQLFTYELKDTMPETIEHAKKEIWSCASEMGFVGHDEFKVVPYNCMVSNMKKYRLEASFNA